MKLQELFKNLIDEIANSLLEYGFGRRSKNILKRIADNKDITLEIYFQTNFNCFGDCFQILPIIAVYSKQLKKEKGDGLGQIYKKEVLNQQNRVWSISEISFNDESKEIIKIIQNNILKIINNFDNEGEN